MRRTTAAKPFIFFSPPLIAVKCVFTHVCVIFASRLGSTLAFVHHSWTPGERGCSWPTCMNERPRFGVGGGGRYDEWTKRLSECQKHKNAPSGREPWKGGDGKKRLYSCAQAWHLVKTSFRVLGAVSDRHPLFATGTADRIPKGGGRGGVATPSALFLPTVISGILPEENRSDFSDLSLSLKLFMSVSSWRRGEPSNQGSGTNTGATSSSKCASPPGFNPLCWKSRSASGP